MQNETLNLIENAVTYIQEKNRVSPVFYYLILNVILVFFILCDFFTGIVASRHAGKGIESTSWGLTVSKFFGLTLYFTLTLFLLIIFLESRLFVFIVYTPVILFILREFISIGENIEKRYGSKPYLFIFVDKLFDILELRFLKFFENKNYEK